MSADDVEYWKRKYELLEEQFCIQKNRNEELETRLLDMVEKIEDDKISLAHEIDLLTLKLESADKLITSLKEGNSPTAPTNTTDSVSKTGKSKEFEPEDPIMEPRSLRNKCGERMVLNGTQKLPSGCVHLPVLSLDEGLIYGFRWSKDSDVRVV